MLDWVSEIYIDAFILSHNIKTSLYDLGGYNEDEM